MEYEKAYKEALERAKKLKAGFEGYNANVAIIEKIFPELRESEDERIIDEIEGRLRMGCGSGQKEYEDVEELCFWLERQKEQKPSEWSEEDEKILNELLDHCNTENATWYNWLKSLRPQLTWKPSEEQMKHLLTLRLMLSPNPLFESLCDDLQKLL